MNTRGYDQVPPQIPIQENFIPQRSYTGQNNLNYNSQPSVPVGYPSYNPQQYARTGPSYIPPIQTSAFGNAPPVTTHQTYNPAAYATPTQSTSYDWPLYNSAENTFTQPQQGPPVPPRPYEYASRVSYSPQPSVPPRSYSGAVPSLPTSPQSSYPAAYTPPAPPPPPFSAAADFPSSPVNNRPYGAISPTMQNTEYASRVDSAFINPNHRLPPLPSYPSLPTYDRGEDYIKATTENENGYQRSPNTSSHPSVTSSPIPQPSPHTPQRSLTANRHPQLRPLPGPPPASYEEAENQEDEAGFEVDELLDEVEATVMGRSPVTPIHRSPRTETLTAEPVSRESNSPNPLFSERDHPPLSPDMPYSHTNGNGKSPSGVESAGIDVNYDAYSDNSDAEAAAGLAAMQMAEEQEAADNARRNTFSNAHSRQFSHASRQSEGTPTENRGYGGGTPLASQYRYDDMATTLSPLDDFGLPPEDSIHPFPAFAARTDTGGSGGLVEPSSLNRRLSFEDGDEATLVDHESFVDHSSARTTARNSAQSGLESLSRHGSSRPLPRIPGADLAGSRRQTDSTIRPDYPQAPDEYDYGYAAASLAVQKARSVGSTSYTPQIIPPGRSVTDAEQRRRGAMRNNDLYDTLSPDAIGAGPGKLGDIVLPTIPSGKGRKFVAQKLTSNDFRLCAEPWAQSSILAWLKEMTDNESDLKEQAVVDGLVALFTHKVPTMNTADAEVLSNRVVEQMLSCGALIRDEEWVRFGTAEMTGVMFQLTGAGCYSPKLHNIAVSGRCYSYHCMRTLKKLDLQTQALGPQKTAEGWAEYYGLKKEDLENRTQKEVERQYNLHEIITGEDRYMEDLSVLQVLYRDGLAKSPQPIISPQRMASFLRDVFGKVEAVKQANEEHLLPQLKYRQKMEGPWIKGFADIFREWSRKARSAYIEYAISLPRALLKFKKETERNIVFKQFLDQVRSNERSRRLELDSFLKAPIARLQRYGLLLQTVLKHTTLEGIEKANLVIAIEEVKNMTLECDTRFAEQSKYADLEDLSYKLALRPGMEKVQLNLTHRGREIVYRGDLQRRGKGYGWLDVHGILFDHYLVLAKPVQSRDSVGGVKREAYDVSKLVRKFLFDGSSTNKILANTHGSSYS